MSPQAIEEAAKTIRALQFADQWSPLIEGPAIVLLVALLVWFFSYWISNRRPWL
jgi:hypothetical protein